MPVGLGSGGGGGAGLGGGLRPVSAGSDVFLQRLAPRPASEILGVHPVMAQQEAIDRYYQEIERAEMMLEEMAHAKLDDAFKEELRAIEEWYKVLSEVERTTAMYSLFQYISPAQVRFFITVLNAMARRSDPSTSLFSPAPSEKGDSRPGSYMGDGGSDVSSHMLNSDALYDKLSTMSSARSGKAMYSPQHQHQQQQQRRFLDRLSFGEIDKSMKQMDISGQQQQRAGHVRPKSYNDGEVAAVAGAAAATADGVRSSDDWSPILGSSAKVLAPQIKRDAAAATSTQLSPLEQVSPRVDSMDPINSQFLSANAAYARSGSAHARSASPMVQTHHSHHHGQGNNHHHAHHHLRPHSPAPIGPPSRSSSPAPQLSNPAALATGAYYQPHASNNGSPSHDSRPLYSPGPMSQDDDGKNKPAEPIDFKLLQDVPAWLRSLRLHKYTPLFDGLTWKDIVALTDEDLCTLGVNAQGARTKFLKVFIQAKQEATEQGLL
ncbi:Flap-structured DNA-binding and RNA-binding protein [Sorochytrium milnesiophthora]